MYAHVYTFVHSEDVHIMYVWSYIDRRVNHSSAPCILSFREHIFFALSISFWPLYPSSLSTIPVPLVFSSMLLTCYPVSHPFRSVVRNCVLARQRFPLSFVVCFLVWYGCVYFLCSLALFLSLTPSLRQFSSTFLHSLSVFPFHKPCIIT